MRRDERGRLTAKMEAELDALSRRPVQALDLDEMPETTEWSGAVRGRLYRTEALQEPLVTLAALRKVAASAA